MPLKRYTAIRVLPLSVQYVTKENTNHTLYMNVLDIMWQRYNENPSPKSYNVMQRLAISTPYGYIDPYVRRTMVRERFYNFVFKLASFLKLYQSKVGYFKHFVNFVKRKYITMHLAFRGSGVKRIRIEPWRTVIQTNDSAYDYSGVKDITDKLCHILTKHILKDEDVTGIINVQVTTNITSFKKIIDALVNNHVASQNDQT